MRCLAALHLSGLSRTGVFLSTSLTLGGLSMLRLFIYLLLSSDMCGHPCQWSLYTRVFDFPPALKFRTTNVVLCVS